VHDKYISDRGQYGTVCRGELRRVAAQRSRGLIGSTAPLHLSSVPFPFGENDRMEDDTDQDPHSAERNDQKIPYSHSHLRVGQAPYLLLC
jgi:hypothetical protein